MDGFLFDHLPISPADITRKGKPRHRKPVAKPDESGCHPWPLTGGINVVLFAGMGGACQGLEAAGFPVHVAVNHDEIALAAHKALNPFTRHIQADIYEVDPLDATGSRPVHFLHASPDCTDHSVAKGGAPRSPRVRSMPWQVCRWVGVLRKRGLGPEVGTLENVREIRGWNHLVAKRDPTTGRVLKFDGSVAAPGERVPVWEQQLVRNPRKFGKPKRDPATGRLLVKDGRHMVRVAAEGEKVPDSKRVRDRLQTEGRLYRAWKRHMESLGAVYEDRDLCCADYGVPTSRKRLFGVFRFDGQKPAWPEQTHASRKDLDRLNAARAEQDMAPLQPHRAAAEIIDWSLPLPSIFDRSKDLAPATQKRIAVGFDRFVRRAQKPFLVHLTHGGRVHNIGNSAPTMTCAHRGEVAIVGPHLIPTTHSKSPPRAHDGLAPAPTMTAAVNGGEFAVSGFVVSPNHTGPGYDFFRGHGPHEPFQAMTRENGHGVVAAHLTRYHGERRPGEARGVDPDVSLPTSTTENRFGLVGAWMVQHNTGVVGHSADDAVSTMTTLGTQQQVAAAYLTEFRGTSADGQPVNAPAGTMCAGGNRGCGHDGVTAAFLTEYYGVGGQHQHAGDALNTLTTNDRFSVTGADLALPPLPSEKLARARQVAEFLRRHGVWDEREFVIFDINGATWIVVEIGMRMLTPREAAAAHELRMPDLITVFKRDRKGNTVIGADGKPEMVTRPLTKTEAMRLVGNSVPMRMEMLLAQANARNLLSEPMMAAE